MPHSGHVIVFAILEAMSGVLTGVEISVLTISSRSANGWRDKCSLVGIAVSGVGAGVHSVCDIDPDVP